MRDYKLSEIKEICKAHYPACHTADDCNCPLYSYTAGCIFDEDYPKDWVFDGAPLYTKTFPCSIGDKIWFVCMPEDKVLIESGEVKSISLQSDGLWVYAQYESGLTYWHRGEDVNKAIFFNKKDAEIKLKELSE